MAGLLLSKNIYTIGRLMNTWNTMLEVLMLLGTTFSNQYKQFIHKIIYIQSFLKEKFASYLFYHYVMGIH